MTTIERFYLSDVSGRINNVPLEVGFVRHFISKQVLHFPTYYEAIIYVNEEATDRIYQIEKLLHKTRKPVAHTENLGTLIEGDCFYMNTKEGWRLFAIKEISLVGIIEAYDITAGIEKVEPIITCATEMENDKRFLRHYQINDSST